MSLIREADGRKGQDVRKYTLSLNISVFIKVYGSLKKCFSFLCCLKLLEHNHCYLCPANSYIFSGDQSVSGKSWDFLLEDVTLAVLELQAAMPMHDVLAYTAVCMAFNPALQWLSYSGAHI